MSGIHVYLKAISRQIGHSFAESLHDYARTFHGACFDRLFLTNQTDRCASRLILFVDWPSGVGRGPFGPEGAPMNKKMPPNRDAPEFRPWSDFGGQ